MAGSILFVRKNYVCLVWSEAKRLDTLPETNIAPENDWIIGRCFISFWGSACTPRKFNSSPLKFVRKEAGLSSSPIILSWGLLLLNFASMYKSWLVNLNPPNNPKRISTPQKQPASWSGSYKHQLVFLNKASYLNPLSLAGGFPI